MVLRWLGPGEWLGDDRVTLIILCTDHLIIMQTVLLSDFLVILMCNFASNEEL